MIRFIGRSVVLGGILLVILPAALASNLRTRELTLNGAALRDTIISLPERWIEPGTITIRRNTDSLSEFRDWRILDPGNRIWLFKPLTPSDSLLISYDYRAYPLHRSRAHRTLRELVKLGSDSIPREDSLQLIESRNEEDTARQQWTRLSKSGALIRSVQIGTGQDLQLESALNIQIDGRIGKNTDVSAALSDQTTPIQPEGTTETLNELEKVYVSVRGPRASTTLGDFELKLPGGYFDSYERKLAGLSAEVRFDSVQLTGSAATSKGEFFTNSFNGQEANQGPYALSGGHGEIGILVLAGTERVWIDGELLRRGESNDYTIDYSTGEISFTARRLITSDSRIVADFQYSAEEYERFYGSSRVSGGFGSGKLTGFVTFINESDDRNRPLGIGLTDEDKTALRNAGDSAEAAVSPAADSLGPGLGDYVTADTLFDEVSFRIFVFVSRDSLGNASGQWRVTFDEFGVGNGDYEPLADATGTTYFRWVGPGQGSYRPFRRLALPGNHSVFVARTELAPIEGLSLKTEAALGSRDLNSYSSRNDGDNTGHAGAGTVSYASNKLTIAGYALPSISVSGGMRLRDQRFVELNREPEVEFTRDWDAERNGGEEETIRDLTLKLSPIRKLIVSGSYGDLDRPGRLFSRRRSAHATAAPTKFWTTSANLVHITSDDSSLARRGDWVRETVSSRWEFRRVAPRLSAERERKRQTSRIGTSGFRFLDAAGGVGISVSKRVLLDGEYGVRYDDLLDSLSEFNRNSVARTLSSKATWRTRKTGSASVDYTHRERSFASRDSAAITTDLGRLEALLASQNRFFELNWTYEVARTRSQNQILVAVEVEPGTGNYRREGDQFIPDDQGDYILVPRNTGSYEPSTQITLATQFAIRPDELRNRKSAKWLYALSSESEISLEEQTRFPLSARLALLDPSRIQTDSTLNGTLALREDVHVWRLNRKHSLRLRLRVNQSLQNQYLNGGQTRRLRELGARFRYLPIDYLRTETEARISRELLEYRSGVAPDRSIDRSDFSHDETLIPDPLWEPGIELSAAEVRDERSQVQVSQRVIRPHVTLKFSGRGRIDGELSWIHVSSNRPTPPFEVAGGSNRGENFRWSLRGTHQFGQNFSGSLSYTGRVDAGERTIHTARVEARASF